VILAVVAVLLVALSLFLMGAIMAAFGLWRAWGQVLHGHMDSAELTVQFLEIVSMMLKAVVMYLIGVGLYSLFMEPLNVTVALGVETLGDLESKVVSVVVVIMAVTFLEHFIRWENAAQTLQYGAALALVVGALVAFQFYNHRAKEDQRSHGNEQVRAQREMAMSDREQHDVMEPKEDSDAAHQPEAGPRNE